MKRMIRTVIWAVAACLLFCACAPKVEPDNTVMSMASGQENRPVLVSDIPCSFPLVSEPCTLNILASGYGNVQHEDVYVWQKYSQMTGVDVNWTTVKRDERAEAVANALMNRQNIDLILRCKISASRLVQYGENGLVYDLAADGMLQKNAPNCWAYMQKHPETLASITNPDGTIYALPQVNSGAELRVGLKLFVNKGWLERLGLPLPATTEEFRALLEAFKAQDANGNGDLHDEIPLCSANWQSVREALYGAFGLENRGMHNTVVDYDEDKGRVRLIGAASGYRDFLSYMNGLYEDGLLDKYIFTMTDEQWTNQIKNDLVGVFASTNLAWVPADKTDDWVAIEEALEGPQGDKLWSPIRANFHSTGAALIPATCGNPELVLRWLDYFWTDEGTLFYHMGIEGETFTANADGTYDYMPYIYEEMKTQNKSFDDVVATYSPYPGGSNPTVEIAPYFMGGEMAAVPAQAARKLFDYGPQEYWPSFTFTDAENEKLGPIQADIEKYCSAAQVEFVTGERPLADWDAYVQQLHKLKMDELITIYEAALARYREMTA